MNIFDSLKYFSINENWGNASKMSLVLLSKLDAFRHKTGVPFSILCGCEIEGHSKTGEHPKGTAIDGRSDSKKLSLLEAYLMAERFDFKGIGLYPNKGRWFIHLDERKLKDGYRARWIRDDLGEYHSLNAKTLKEYII